MAKFPPGDPNSTTANIFKISYWKSLSDNVDGNPAVGADGFWNDHDEAGEINSWQTMINNLAAVDTYLQQDHSDEPLLYIYKTKAPDDLKAIHAWHNKQGKLTAFQAYVRNLRANLPLPANHAIASHLDQNNLLTPLGGHVGSLAAIQANLQAGTAILRFKMRRGTYSALFRSTGYICFSTAARSLHHAARYFRHRAQGSYLVKKRTVGGAGEGYLAGWIGVKGEDEYMSFAIGDNGKSRALFSIFVDKCEWHTRPDD